MIIMNEEKLITWKMQTSKKWSDIEDVLKAININFIDYDHKMLVEYSLQLNQLIDKLEDNFSIALVEKIKYLFTQIYEYAVDHFHREEIFMEQYKLPNIHMHKNEHERILLMLRNVMEEFSKGKVNIGQNLKQQIMEWLVNHINLFDFNYFNIDIWSKNLQNASDWNELKSIINLTGINVIDSQHKIFTSMAIEVITNIEKNPTEKTIRDEFKRFKDYGDFHFSTEENFIKKYEIKNTEEHKDLHDFFLNKLDSFPDEIIKDIDSLGELKIWILSWWINHINITDSETFKYKNWAYKLIDDAKTIDDVSFLLHLTGFSDIDDDHLKLMKHTLEFNNYIQSLDYAEYKDIPKNSLETVLKYFDDLYYIASEHFDREQHYMISMRIRSPQRHLEEHKKILQKLKELKTNFLEGRLFLSEGIKTMILEWWIEHTNTVDFNTFVSDVDSDASTYMDGGWR
jgi:hemerythrin-like metal-binding protein